MEEKPRINIRRFQSPKIKKKYLIKFAMYVLILLSLWVWYKQQNSKQPNKSVTEITVDSENVEIDNLDIEP